jgi:hypothetical protein
VLINTDSWNISIADTGFTRLTRTKSNKEERVRKEQREARRADWAGSVGKCNTAMVGLIHDSIYGNPDTHQRTHTAREAKAALIISFIWIKNLSWKLNVISNLPFFGVTVDRYVGLCSPQCSLSSCLRNSNGSSCIIRFYILTVVIMKSNTGMWSHVLL